jgi:hypothetical protein
MIDVEIGLFEECSHMMVIDRVIGNVTLAPRFDKAAIP